MEQGRPGVFSKSNQGISDQDSGCDARRKVELNAWVMSGHDPYDNPYSVWGENGFPLDYISALRFWRDFEPSGKGNENPASAEEDIDPFRDDIDPFAEEPPNQK